MSEFLAAAEAPLRDADPDLPTSGTALSRQARLAPYVDQPESGNHPGCKDRGRDAAIDRERQFLAQLLVSRDPMFSPWQY
jgi:hypothetical protein